VKLTTWPPSSDKIPSLYTTTFMMCRWTLLYCIILYRTVLYCKKVKIKEYRNRPGVAQRVPGGLGSQISMTFGTWRCCGCQPHAPAAFNPRKCSWYSFSLGAESTPGPWYGRKEYVTEKSSDITGNPSRYRPTSSEAP
jgi:hypothetical protein